ncbi:hypothetical protein SAMN04487943_103412 [Gracilibacillus orientalis]|uniref:Uncharacterized protein n=1 Tax=Gracilibacillus orientalis TaxID=334253 RepID=A0A1I4K8E8_9BACI|nr:hypothetical protein SAMN04487943_103412 [Gracilibacillus orientalis]
MGTARVEDPTEKRTLLFEEAEAVPTESAVFCRSDVPALSMERMEESLIPEIFTVALRLSTSNQQEDLD